MPVVAEKNEIGSPYIDHLKKYIPVLKLPEYNLTRAADYLDAWVKGELIQKPLLDVSACFHSIVQNFSV